MSSGRQTQTAMRVTLPDSSIVLRVAVSLRAVLAGRVDDATLREEAQRILRLYLNTNEPGEPTATLRDLRVTARQAGWQGTAFTQLVVGDVVEDPAYFDVATFGPLPDEPLEEGPCRYMIGGVRVWLDPDLADADDEPELWLCPADQAAHTALDRALRPHTPRGYRYGPADRTGSWPFCAVVDPDLVGFG